jgi:hypothetical protein
MIGILYSSGSHGKFLEMLLNLFSGLQLESNPITDNCHVYDGVAYQPPKIFEATHRMDYLSSSCDEIINIRITPCSYMKYIAVCFNRTSGINIILEELHQDTFDKIKHHRIFSHFLPSLKTVSGISSGDVEIKYLREWARLCFFGNNGATIKKFTNPTKYPSADYFLNFECFYNDELLLEQCKLILHKFNLPIFPVANITEYLSAFKKNNRYRNIDKDIDLITQSIVSKQNYEFNSENFIKQAWIDNWLVSTYDVNVKLKNDYWTNTREIIEAYNL